MPAPSYCAYGILMKNHNPSFASTSICLVMAAVFALLALALVVRVLSCPAPSLAPTNRYGSALFQPGAPEGVKRLPFSFQLKHNVAANNLEQLASHLPLFDETLGFSRLVLGDYRRTEANGRVCRYDFVFSRDDGFT